LIHYDCHSFSLRQPADLLMPLIRHCHATFSFSLASAYAISLSFSLMPFSLLRHYFAIIFIAAIDIFILFFSLHY
jgi:hypothetical protein